MPAWLHHHPVVVLRAVVSEIVAQPRALWRSMLQNRRLVRGHSVTTVQRAARTVPVIGERKNGRTSSLPHLQEILVESILHTRSAMKYPRSWAILTCSRQYCIRFSRSWSRCRRCRMNRPVSVPSIPTQELLRPKGIVEKREGIPPMMPMATTTYTHVPTWFGIDVSTPQTPLLRQFHELHLQFHSR